jgi:hypothetical protein
MSSPDGDGDRTVSNKTTLPIRLPRGSAARCATEALDQIACGPFGQLMQIKAPPGQLVHLYG